MSRRLRVTGIVAAVVLLLGCAGSGIWLLTHWIGPQTEPAVVLDTSVQQPSSLPKRNKLPDEKASVTDTTSKPDVKLVEKKPVEKKPPEDKPPIVVKPPPPNRLPPPLPPPRSSVEEKKVVTLTDDLLPELEFQIVDVINAQREKAGLDLVFLDEEASRGCRAHAAYLARNAGRLSDKEADGNDEDAKRPSSSKAGRKSAHTATILAADPLAAIEKWLMEPARRALILEPRLRTVGAGFTRNMAGQWFSVFDWTSGIDREPPLKPSTVTEAILFPAHRQMRVPLWFPGNETPDPIPDATNKVAGYPITLMFPPQTRVDSLSARLSSKDADDVPVWLSSPEKPANPRFADAQQNTICLIPKQALKPNTRYRVDVTAKVDGKPWSAKWSFTTMTSGEIHHEMAGKLLRTLNTHRRRAGLKPIPLDAERSKTCAAHALYLGANAPYDPMLNWNEEKRNLPGYSEEGAALARTASMQGGGGPVEAVTGLVDSLISRSRLLDPHLQALSLGYTPFARGGWIWVMSLQLGRGPNTSVKELLYPAPDQEDVPLLYPADEVPSPIPSESKVKEAGYAITAEFPAGVKMTDVTAKLVDGKGKTLEGWLSTPDHPAVAGYPQRSVCLLPRTPLKPDTRYTATFKALVNGQPWARTWSFTTLKELHRFADDFDEKILARVNALRKSAGLPVVRLDAELSRGCQLHAHYLVINEKLPAARGLAVHREDATLPGATPEGARAAKGSVIATMLDPQACVDGWMATLYHRIPILSPNLQRVGFGHARMGRRKWVCVLDTGNGRTTSP